MSSGFWPGSHSLREEGDMPRKNTIQHINYPPAKIRRIESFQGSGGLQKSHAAAFDADSGSADEEPYIPIPAPVVVIETETSESSEEEDDGSSGEAGFDSLVNATELDARDPRQARFDTGRLNQLMAGAVGSFSERSSGNGKRSGSRASGSGVSSRISALDNLVPSSSGGALLSPGSSHGDGGGSSSGGAAGGAFNPAVKFGHVTVQWLLENYETAEGVSLPRSTLYFHYIRHCNEHKLDPVNAASFGKLIRSVFLGLRTRRLGTRGNSKYHYYGIRLKPNSPLVNVTESGDRSPHSQQGGCSSPGSVGGESGDGAIPAKKMKPSKGDHYEVSHHGVGVNMSDPYSIQQQFLGDPSLALENLPELDLKIQVPNELNLDDLLIFRTLYREHCETLLDTMANFQLSQVEAYWRQFWRNGGGQTDSMEHEYEKMLPKSKLQLLCTIKEVQDFIRETDYQFYQNIVNFLLPDVLRPIPSSMTQAIRNFAKTLENWLTSAMQGYSGKIVSVKVTCVNALAQTLRRYTSLNHLAQAARAVLQNQNQISQMLSDLNRVDFHNVEEQAYWVCGCDGEMVPSLEQDFKRTLAQQHTLEQWSTWLEGVVDKILRPYADSPKFVQAARHFLLKWSFYSSLVIRDLTLRSAASFGSFHLLRLLFDEYMFYLVEHRVAQVTNVVPIAVIGNKSLESLATGMPDLPVLSQNARLDENASRPILKSPSHSRASAGSSNGSGNDSPGSSSSASEIQNHQQQKCLSQPGTVAGSAGHVNVHVDSKNPVGVIVPKAEMKRVKHFLTV